MDTSTYMQHLTERKYHHFGYPYNLDFAFSQEFGGLLDFFINNLGDPYIASNYQLDSRSYEQAVIAYFAQLWNFSQAWGYVTSSGTEGNLAALWYGKMSLDDPIVYYSDHTHYSVAKACLAYSLDSITIPTSEDGEINYHELAEQIHPWRDAIIICNLSTTFRGAYDSAKKIRETFSAAGVSREHLFIHGDAALGGFILPWLDDVQADYRIEGQEFDSISVSGHKMPGSPIPCGVVLTRKGVVDYIAREIEYLNSRDTTLNGSRNGLAAVLLHHTLLTPTRQQWREKVQRCVSHAQYLHQALRLQGLTASLNSYSNTVVFPRPDETIVQHWQLACVGDEAHAIVMPQHSRDIIDEFVAQLVQAQQAPQQRSIAV